MKKVYLSALRDIRFHKSRSVIIILAVVLVTAFPLALNNVTPNLTHSINSEADQYHLAHFNFIFSDFIPSNFSNTIQSWIYDAIHLNASGSTARVFLASKYLRNNGNWISSTITSVENPIPKVNDLVLTEGQYPKQNNEVVLLDSFAKAENYTLGDSIKLYPRGIATEYKIVGLGRTIEFSSFNLVQSAVVFMNPQTALNYLFVPRPSDYRNSFVYYYGNLSLDQEKLVVKTVENKVRDLSKSGFPPIAFSWLTREVSFRKSLSDALTVTGQYMQISTLFIYLIAGIVIFVVMNRYINDQKVIIGASHAFGVTKRELIQSFLLRLTILFVIGWVLGYFFGILLLRSIVDSLGSSWGLFSVSAVYTRFSIISVLLLGVIFIYGFSMLALQIILRLTPYEAMRGKSSELKSKGFLLKLSRRIPYRPLRFGFRNLTRNRTRTVLTVVSFIWALVFATSILYTNSSLDYTVNTYFDNHIKFDTLVDIGFSNSLNQSFLLNLGKSLPIQRAEPIYEGLNVIKDRPNIVAYLHGILYNTTLYTSNLISGRDISQNSSDIVISSYLSIVGGYKLGDTLSLRFFGSVLNFTVVGIENDVFRTSTMRVSIEYLSYFVKLPTSTTSYGMNNLPFYNKFLVKFNSGSDVSKQVDNLNSNFPLVTIAISTKTFRVQQVNLLNNQAQVILILVILSLLIGFLSVFTTQYISLIERDKEIALMRVFGFFKSEILFQTSLEFLIIAVSSLIVTYIISPYVTIFLWLKLISQTLIYLEPVFPDYINIFIFFFTFGSIFVSLLFSFNRATQIPTSEAVREDY